MKMKILMKKFDLDELYWGDWKELLENSNKLEELFLYIEDYDSRSVEELSQILKLYSNPSGVFTIEFADIVAELYKSDKIKFMKALNLVQDEAINLVYIFRNLQIFSDGDEELKEVLSKENLSQNEIDTASIFYQMYKNICSS
ncbi:hypothetical protein KQI41_06385 [Tissierella pigra]|uniref:hypothetical protein n=1 Tax=Tissierella pigra TaxID=2607614 RepID=UPI001C121622|nr:hypothetical protein [Tissierella pigra]MBU5426039.1 hypothetical protein [Tissierella pigra]